ncbi:ABC transporter ATP-binding protein uup-1 [Periconia macrospinosa]|uniref:ABC transporter ATP-binding protein uup-1 n=1 Tax=Periconia macrospinosa TaxID=97972 RepID=A0A2V1DCU1_9PLEO|nr:ABC transporter ATP-binding protein uup-1 [Periconia macrospinosa]
MVRRGKDVKTAAAATAESADASSQAAKQYITVTAQQSRYALDAVDAPASKEVCILHMHVHVHIRSNTYQAKSRQITYLCTFSQILVKDLSISVSDRELLSHATLHLVEGRHYVLVGRNGTGKSTLLKAMGEGLIPGIPWSTRILLLGQTREVGEGEEERGAEETVLQHVVRSDRVRERYMREARMLSDAIEHSTDPMAPVKTYRRIAHERLGRQLEEAQRIAERRSGARGKLARKDLIKFEERFEESKARVLQEESEIEPTKLSEDTHAAAEMLASVQATLELMDASAAEKKARSVLLGLGFKQDRIDQPFSELSGGWKTRCDLACALCQYADVLLLDEPTNFLDLPSIIWLQDYIRNLTGTTVLVTTHDRDFGDAVAEELIVLRNQNFETFRGNLSLYERERYKKARYLTKMKEAQDKQKKHMEKTVANNIKAARDKGDDKKLKQAASRKKKLDERMGMEVGLRGGRFKLNRDLAGYHTSNRAEIEIPDFDAPVKMTFPRQPPDLRFPGALVSLEKVCFAYPSKRKVAVLNDINLTIHPGQRVGLAGLNGSGKTTLISLIVGSGDDAAEGGLTPTSGNIARHPRAKFGRFSQQSVEEVTVIAAANPRLSALSHLRQHCGDDMDEKEARQLLASLGLQGHAASDVPLGLLSGGQKVRVGLAKLLWPPPQLLILDEVTTHLDADTILGLIKALREYDGALVVVTHDRFFMRYVHRSKQ